MKENKLKSFKNILFQFSFIIQEGKTLTFHFFSTTKDRIEHTERLPIFTPVWCRMDRWKIFLHWKLRRDEKFLSRSIGSFLCVSVILRVWHSACSNVSFLQRFLSKILNKSFSRGFPPLLFCFAFTIPLLYSRLIQWTPMTSHVQMSNFNVLVFKTQEF